jgi:hypothetical protein
VQELKVQNAMKCTLKYLCQFTAVSFENGPKVWSGAGKQGYREDF